GGGGRGAERASWQTPARPAPRGAATGRGPGKLPPPGGPRSPRCPTWLDLLTQKKICQWREGGVAPRGRLDRAVDRPPRRPPALAGLRQPSSANAARNAVVPPSRLSAMPVANVAPAR